MAEPEQVVSRTIEPGVVARIVEDVYQLCRGDYSGAPADYIPELAAVQPDSFGLCLATADGRVYGTGDVASEFTSQSISKPFTYALALTDRGPDAVAGQPQAQPRDQGTRAVGDAGRAGAQRDDHPSQSQLALLEPPAAKAHAQMDAAVQAIAVRRGDY